jgi:F-type H+-transporting ATPase subunit delta
MMDIISADIELIFHSMEQSRELARVLENPVIKPEVKVSILDEIFKSKVNAETMHFIRFLVKKGREKLLQEIAEKFLKLRDEREGIVTVIVRAAFELSDSQAAELQDKIEKMLSKKARLKIKIDPEVVGGFIAQVNDTVYDASVKHQLVTLKQKLLRSGSAALN